MTPPSPARQPKLLIVLKGYPRLSETFIAQELLGLQMAGIGFDIVSLRQPYDAKHHPVHEQITASVLYLPEYLHEAPVRVLKAALRGLRRPGFRAAFRLFWQDLRRDISRNRVRRFGQALVLAAEGPQVDRLWLHAHFAHTPASVARYAAHLLGAPFTISAHAKDIWTSPDWELTEKLRDACWTVTCTASGRDHLAGLAPEAAVHLSYHGLDLARFPPPGAERLPRTGADPDDPVCVLSVGRAVPKKGYDTLLTALAQLPPDLHWRFDHIGSGSDVAALKAQATRLGLNDRITWHGPQDQRDVLAAYRRADVFALASRQTEDGDRDGLPNVLVEAASQAMACVSTRFSAIPEFFEDGVSALLVPPQDPEALATALHHAIADPALRQSLGAAAEARARRDFDFQPGIARLKSLFETAWAAP